MRTIVGGRPQKDGGAGGRAARGIDVLLLKGSVDAEFRAELSRDWSAAASGIGLDLTEAECAVLASIPGDVLADMAVRVRVPKAHRPVFLGKVAAAMLVLVAGLAAGSCSPPPPKPVKPVPSPFASPGSNEPEHWQPRLVTLTGILPLPGTRRQHFEDDDEVPEPGDMDPASVNEPEVWNPPMPIFGIAPEWNERTHDWEEEDEEEGEAR